VNPAGVPTQFSGWLPVAPLPVAVLSVTVLPSERGSVPRWLVIPPAGSDGDLARNRACIPQVAALCCACLHTDVVASWEGSRLPMDQTTFDSLTRMIGAGASRRGTLALLTTLATGGASLAEPDATAARSRKCAAECDICFRCKKGKCRRKHGKKRCRKGKCVPTAGEACPGGACLSNGSCGILCSVSPDCPSGCLCAINTEGERFCHFTNTVCGVHSQCSDTADCPRGEQCQDCAGANHCLLLCTV
jgi:hypothetical protein